VLLRRLVFEGCGNLIEREAAVDELVDDM